MKKTLALILGLSTMLHAIGLGVYIPISFLNTEKVKEHVYEDTSSYRERDVRYKPSIGIGFLFDTNIEKDNVFNYRFNFEYVNQQISDDSQETKRPEQWRYNLSHTIGLALYRSHNVRVWVGNKINYSIYNVIDGYGEQINVIIFAYIIPVIGLNYHYNDSLSLGVDMDYQVATSDPSFFGSERSAYHSNTRLLTMRFSIIYKFNDSFNEFKRVKKPL